ncbi:MAG: hypothetical protein ABTD50_07680 [Polyangiaceae bacterium]|jgi:hypothetical protein
MVRPASLWGLRCTFVLEDDGVQGAADPLSRVANLFDGMASGQHLIRGAGEFPITGEVHDLEGEDVVGEALAQGCEQALGARIAFGGEKLVVGSLRNRGHSLEDGCRVAGVSLPIFLVLFDTVDVRDDPHDVASEVGFDLGAPRVVVRIQRARHCLVDEVGRSLLRARHVARESKPLGA